MKKCKIITPSTISAPYFIAPGEMLDAIPPEAPNFRYATTTSSCVYNDTENINDKMYEDIYCHSANRGVFYTLSAFMELADTKSQFLMTKSDDERRALAEELAVHVAQLYRSTMDDIVEPLSSIPVRTVANPNQVGSVTARWRTNVKNLGLKTTVRRRVFPHNEDTAPHTPGLSRIDIISNSEKFAHAIIRDMRCDIPHELLLSREIIARTVEPHIFAALHAATTYARIVTYRDTNFIAITIDTNTVYALYDSVSPKGLKFVNFMPLLEFVDEYQLDKSELTQAIADTDSMPFIDMLFECKFALSRAEIRNAMFPDADLISEIKPRTTARQYPIKGAGAVNAFIAMGLLNSYCTSSSKQKIISFAEYPLSASIDCYSRWLSLNDDTATMAITAAYRHNSDTKL